MSLRLTCAEILESLGKSSGSLRGLVADQIRDRAEDERSGWLEEIHALAEESEHFHDCLAQMEKAYAALLALLRDRAPRSLRAAIVAADLGTVGELGLEEDGMARDMTGHGEFSGGPGMIDPERRALGIIGQDAGPVVQGVGEELWEIYATNPADPAADPVTSVVERP